MDGIEVMPPIAVVSTPGAVSEHGGTGEHGASTPFPVDFEVSRFSPQSENLGRPSVEASGTPTQRGRKGGKTAKLTRLVQEIGADTAKFFEEVTVACQAEAKEVVDLEARGGERLYGYLGRCFKFVRDQRFDSENFAKYCRSKKLTCTKATRKNNYLCAIRATGSGINNKLASKYAKALQWLADNLPADQDITEFLRASGGIEGCLKLERKSRRTQVDHRVRATGCSLAVIGVPVGLTGTVSLVVAIEEGRARFVSYVGQEPDVSSQLASVSADFPNLPSEGVGQGGNVPAYHEQGSDEGAGVRPLGNEETPEIPAQPDLGVAPDAGNSADDADEA